MKKLLLFLAVLIVLLQYRLWFSDDGLPEMDRLENRLLGLKDEVAGREARNASLEADVRDLKEGNEAIEERARQELGMIRGGEVFVQVIDSLTPPEEAAKTTRPGASKP